VADFIGESNILNGVMIEDELVEFAGLKFECVDKGFAPNEPVDVVIRPEDIYIFEMSDTAQFSGQVTSSIFKGVHYEMMVTTPGGIELMVQDYHCFEAGKTVGLHIKPMDIHVMKKERHFNSFEGIVIDKAHVRVLGKTLPCNDAARYGSGVKVKARIDFSNVILHDNEEDGDLRGMVNFILYKGNHFHLTVQTEDNENIFVDTNDIWDDGDHVGLSIPAESILLETF
jgi:spermidine/putrescine transport system ATP-binding protein